MSRVDIVLGLDLLNDIFVIIDDHPMLPEEQNKALARRVRAGDTEARDQLILHNLRLVVSIVKPYLRTHMIRTQLAQDIMNEGIIGMCQAIEKYDPDLGWNFSTYAVWWIRQAITRWRAKQTMVNISQHAFEHAIKIRQCQHKGITDPQEIATHADLPISHVQYALSCMSLTYRSLDVVFADEEDQGLTMAECLLDDIEDEYEAIDNAIDHQASVQRLLAVLKPSDCYVVQRLFGLGGKERMGTTELANHLGISRQRIDQIYRRAKDQMRRAAETRGIKAS